jgi:hypothetical protein
MRQPYLPRSLGDRKTRIFILAVTGVFATLAFVWAVQLWVIVDSHRSGFGVDFNQYQAHVTRWLATGQFYLPRQLAGPTQVMDGDPLYPPIALLLLVPFQVLPAILWWAIPLGITAYVLVRLRPVAWTWPILAIIALWPRTPALIYYGNPGMWAVAAVAAGVMWRWPAPFVLFKPSLAPFALIGIGPRGWFACLAAVALVCVPFGSLWIDYLTALRNSSVPLTYSLLDLPLTLAPLVAWAGRSDRSVGWNPRRAHGGRATPTDRTAGRLGSGGEGPASPGAT